MYYHLHHLTKINSKVPLELQEQAQQHNREEPVHVADGNHTITSSERTSKSLASNKFLIHQTKASELKKLSLPPPPPPSSGLHGNRNDLLLSMVPTRAESNRPAGIVDDIKNHSGTNFVSEQSYHHCLSKSVGKSPYFNNSGCVGTTATANPTTTNKTNNDCTNNNNNDVVQLKRYYANEKGDTIMDNISSVSNRSIKNESSEDGGTNANKTSALVPTLSTPSGATTVAAAAVRSNMYQKTTSSSCSSGNQFDDNTNNSLPLMRSSMMIQQPRLPSIPSGEKIVFAPPKTTECTTSVSSTRAKGVDGKKMIKKPEKKKKNATIESTKMNSIYSSTPSSQQQQQTVQEVFPTMNTFTPSSKIVIAASSSSSSSSNSNSNINNNNGMFLQQPHHPNSTTRGFNQLNFIGKQIEQQQQQQQQQSHRVPVGAGWKQQNAAPSTSSLLSLDSSMAYSLHYRSGSNNVTNPATTTISTEDNANDPKFSTGSSGFPYHEYQPQTREQRFDAIVTKMNTTTVMRPSSTQKDVRSNTNVPLNCDYPPKNILSHQALYQQQHQQVNSNNNDITHTNPTRITNGTSKESSKSINSNKLESPPPQQQLQEQLKHQRFETVNAPLVTELSLEQKRALFNIFLEKEQYSKNVLKERLTSECKDEGLVPATEMSSLHQTNLASEEKKDSDILQHHDHYTRTSAINKAWGVFHNSNTSGSINANSYKKDSPFLAPYRDSNPSNNDNNVANSSRCQRDDSTVKTTEHCTDITKDNNTHNYDDDDYAAAQMLTFLQVHSPSKESIAEIQQMNENERGLRSIGNKDYDNDDRTSSHDTNNESVNDNVRERDRSDSTVIETQPQVPVHQEDAKKTNKKKAKLSAVNSKIKPSMLKTATMNNTDSNSFIIEQSTNVDESTDEKPSSSALRRRTGRIGRPPKDPKEDSASRKDRLINQGVSGSELLTIPDLRNELPPWVKLVGRDNRVARLEDRDELFIPEDESLEAADGKSIGKKSVSSNIKITQAIRERARTSIDPSFDALFVAMAQMIPCTLNVDDQNSAITSYKHHELGFPGLRCKHCGGRPGSGRYFPNSVRSLSQTTTAHNMIKHFVHASAIVPDDDSENETETINNINSISSQKPNPSGFETENDHNDLNNEQLTRKGGAGINTKLQRIGGRHCTNCPYSVWLWLSEFQRRLADCKTTTATPSGEEHGSKSMTGIGMVNSSGEDNCNEDDEQQQRTNPNVGQRVKYGARKIFYGRVWSRMNREVSRSSSSKDNRVPTLDHYSHNKKEGNNDEVDDEDRDDSNDMDTDSDNNDKGDQRKKNKRKNHGQTITKTKTKNREERYGVNKDDGGRAQQQQKKFKLSSNETTRIIKEKPGRITFLDLTTTPSMEAAPSSNTTLTFPFGDEQAIKENDIQKEEKTSTTEIETLKLRTKKQQPRKNFNKKRGWD